MGWTWEVDASVWSETNGRYEFVELYRGQSWFQALRAAREGKKRYDSAIQVIWR